MNTKLELKFVESLPRPLEDGILYVSIRFRIAAHDCCCGCGNEVITNISPRGWQLTYDGETISLFPSIGNWTLPCRSHYWIVNNKVHWAKDRSTKQILDTLRINALTKSSERPVLPKGDDAVGSTKKRFWQKLFGGKRKQ